MMFKTKYFWTLTSITILIIVALIFLLPGSNTTSSGKAKLEPLSEGEYISVNTWPEHQSVQLGDLFRYNLEVLYNPNEVSGIDSVSLDQNINFDPFEIVSTKDTEYDPSSGIRLYQKIYELQLIDGETEFLYEFPTIVVRYKLHGIDGYAETSVIPNSVFVVSRLPVNMDAVITSLELGDEVSMPLAGQIEDTGYNLPKWICWIIGIFLFVLIVTDIIIRIIPAWKEKEKQTKMIEENSFIYQAYHSLNKNIESGDDPETIFHQMELTLRTVLSDKEMANWLEEPNFQMIPNTIRPKVIDLFNKCQEIYRTNKMNKNDIDEAWNKLKDILKFYYSKEIEAWNN